MTRNISIFIFIFLALAATGCGKNEPQAEGSHKELLASGACYPVTLEFPADWTVDTEQDYCEIIAYGPDDVYAILTVYPRQDMSGREHVMKLLQTFSFYEDFTVLEDALFRWGDIEGGAVIYSYKETSQNESFTEYSVYREDSEYFYFLQNVAPSDKFEQYRDDFYNIAVTLKTGL